MASSPKRPEKTAQEAAIERRQSMMLDDEISESEERLRLISRGKLGRDSLLSGAPTNSAQAANRGGRSIMSGKSSGGYSPGSSATASGRTGGTGGGSGGGVRIQ